MKLPNPFKRKQKDSKVDSEVMTAFMATKRSNNVNSVKKTRKGAPDYTHLRQSNPKPGFKIPKIELKFKNYRARKIVYFLPVIILLLAFGYYSVFSTDTFVVTSVEFTNGANIIPSIEKEFEGRNIFSFSNTDVERYVKNNVVNVDWVIARKVFPNKIEVDFKQINVVGYVYNFEGTGIVNSDMSIYDFNLLSNPFNPEEYELNALKGNLLINDPVVQERIINNLEDAEKETFSWDEVEDIRKFAMVKEIQNEIQTKVNEFFNEATNTINSSSLMNVYFYNSDLEKEQFNSEKLAMSSKIFNNISSLEIHPSRIIWFTDSNIRVETDQGKVFFFKFTTDRTFEKQWEDLAIFLRLNGLEAANFFDVRVDEISVWN